jgi:general secretion pathway protein H
VRAVTRLGAQRGFTLLELLVVLAIVGVVLVLVPGFLLRGQPGLDVEAAARAIAGALRETRADAMQHNREQLFALDVEERLFRAGTGRAPVQIDRAIEVTFQTARQEQVGETIGQIRFFPDGSSTGGRIGLSRDGRHTAVSIDWLTGLVAVEHALE